MHKPYESGRATCYTHNANFNVHEHPLPHCPAAVAPVPAQAPESHEQRMVRQDAAWVRVEDHLDDAFPGFAGVQPEVGKLVRRVARYTFRRGWEIAGAQAPDLDLTDGLTHAELDRLAGLAHDVEDHEVTREMRRGTVDALREYERLIGSVRPLVAAQAPAPEIPREIPMGVMTDKPFSVLNPLHPDNLEALVAMQARAQAPERAAIPEDTIAEVVRAWAYEHGFVTDNSTIGVDGPDCEGEAQILADLAQRLSSAAVPAQDTAQPDPVHTVCPGEDMRECGPPVQPDPGERTMVLRVKLGEADARYAINDNEMRLADDGLVFAYGKYVGTWKFQRDAVLREIAVPIVEASSYDGQEADPDALREIAVAAVARWWSYSAGNGTPEEMEEPARAFLTAEQHLEGNHCVPALSAFPAPVPPVLEDERRRDVRAGLVLQRELNVSFPAAMRGYRALTRALAAVPSASTEGS